MSKLRALSLFAGIGGFDLGLERTGGFEIVGQCEIEPFQRAVLRKHWPEVQQIEDIHDIERFDCDVICGGFPCQPFSTASRGRRVAVDLWPEMRRVVDGSDPSYVIAENVMVTDLITRLSKLDAPDREVDAEIALQNGWQVFPGDNWIGPEGKIVVPEYTRSVDAAIALAERVLPGWKWRVGRTELFPNGWAYVHKYDPSNCDRKDEAACADGKAANPAIALCIALLRAKEASNA